MGILGKIFTWWDGATIGTHLWASRAGGEHVGTFAADLHVLCILGLRESAGAVAASAGFAAGFAATTIHQ